MELWDVYNENRVLTGKKHVRGKPFKRGEYHLVADIWTVAEDNRILVTRRHPNKPSGLMWECSGGSVKTGETSVEGAVRELWEEVGIKAKPEELHLMHTICLKERFVDTYITRQNITMEDIKLQKEEVVDAKLVSYSELLNMWDEGVIVPKSRFLLYKDKIKEFIQSPS